MKKVTLLLTVVMAFALGATAQQGGGRQRFSPEEMLKRRIETVKQEVKQVTAEQEKKITELFTATQKKQQELFQSGGGGGNWEANREKFQKMTEEETAALKKIFTEEQFKAYNAYLEKQRKEMEERRGRGPGGQGGPGGGGPGGQGGPGGGGGPR